MPWPTIRVRALDETKRLKIVALLRNGCSRRSTANYVGCAPSTITRTAARDRDFAAQITQAERGLEVESLRAIRSAAKKDRYWRAAAWVLERKNPDEFAARPPKLYTPAELAQVLSHLVFLLQGDQPEVNCQLAIEWLDQLMLDVGEDPETCETALTKPDEAPPERPSSPEFEI